ncbi:GATA transcription factor 1-like [Telopea speciosissima]|uniref:GATA transcription factor 1-like n=1 Tax=Telopea speciosissima TaxID=54955 RepID=UPI001CC7988F|nr:GATA transcription factor 1-like [Telopea speciosissima]
MVSFGAGFIVEEFLDFSSDIGEEDEEEDNKQSNSNNFPTTTTTNNNNKALSSSSTLDLDSKPTNPATHQIHQPQREAQTVLNIFDLDDDHHHSFPEFLEEELEWITNGDAFPGVETFDDIFPGKLSKGPNNHSPVSVLENSSSSSNNSGIMICCASLRVPVRARSKRRRRKRSGFSDLSGQQWRWWCERKNKSNGGGATLAAANETIMATIGRKCWHCGAEKTPQWRAGPHGPKTLCNACGVRYKSGRLVPEYRPASSPSYSNELHSNSHRKILEMRKQKQQELLMESVDKG